VLKGGLLVVDTSFETLTFNENNIKGVSVSAKKRILAPQEVTSEFSFDSNDSDVIILLSSQKELGRNSRELTCVLGDFI